MSVFSSLWDRIKSHSVPKAADEKQRQERQFKKGNRLIIFKDHDVRGRKVLFDSMYEDSSASGSCCQKESSSGCRKKPLADTKLLGEMMFGSVPMPHKTSTLKVHAMKSPPQLMITKVFLPVPISHESSGEHESFDLYSIQVLEPTPTMTEKTSTTAPKTISGGRLTSRNSQSLASSLPMDVPCCQSVAIEICPSATPCDDSGFSTSAASSPTSLITNTAPSPSSSLASLSSSFNGSRCRRYQQHQRTQLEFSLSNSFNCTDQTELLPLHKRPVKIGIGIIFMLNSDDPQQNVRFEQFFFSHIMLIESYVHKLKASVDQALVAKSRSVICQAKEAFFSSIYALFTAPRVPRPVWLDIMTHRTQRDEICGQFVHEFVCLAKKYDTKSSRFFLSCLITAVLTHHLSWAATVAPAAESALHRPRSKLLKRLAHSHPYNPLWAQLGDLYGAIGFPCCMCRTLVVGKNAQLIDKFLRVLTYFIRCSELVEHHDRFPVQKVFSTPDSMSSSAPHSPSDSATSVIGALIDGRSTDPGPIQCSAGSVKLNDSISTKTASTNSLSAVSGGVNCAVVLSSSDDRISENCDSAQQKMPRGLARVHFDKHDSDAVFAENVSRTSATSGEVESNDVKLPSGVRVLTGRPSVLLRDVPASVFEALSEKQVAVEGCNDRYTRICITCPDVTDESSSSKSLNQENPQDSSKSLSPTDSEKHRQLCCQLSPNSINENAARETERRLGREVVDLLPPIAPVDLVDPAVGKTPYDDGNLRPMSTESEKSDDAVTQKPCFNRGTSMFDEYFVSVPPVHELISNGDLLTQKSASSSVYSQDADLDDIMNEPLPDLDDFPVVKKPTPGSMQPTESGTKYVENRTVTAVKSNESSSKPDADMNSVVFFNDHFASPPVPSDARKNLGDLPEGPSKQMLQSTIELMRNVVADRTVAADGDYDEELNLSVGGLTPQAMVTSAGSMGGAPASRSRQRHASGQSNTSLRCRSVTPSESNCSCRRVSSSSNDFHSSTLFDRLVEIPIPLSSSETDVELAETAAEPTGCPNNDFNLGRSLLGGYCTQYQSEFVLHGCPNSPSLKPTLHQDLQLALKNPALDERIDEASCIVADVDSWKVELFSCKYSDPGHLKVQPLVSSQLVAGIIESMLDLWQMKASPEFCLMHLEDQLQSVYLKSKMLAEYIKAYHVVFPHELAATHGFDVSDMPLLLAIAGSHSPDLLRTIATAM